MKLRTSSRLNLDTGQHIITVTPEAEPPADPLGDIVEINYRQSLRKVSGAILQMALHFNSQHAERQRLEHDCVMYALSCITGDAQEGVQRNRDRFKLTPLTDRLNPSDYPDGLSLQPDQAILLYRIDDQDNFVDGAHHFIVQASVDGQLPHIYSSKMGDKGKAVLQTFRDTVNYFGANALCIMTMSHVPEQALAN